MLRQMLEYVAKLLKNHELAGEVELKKVDALLH